MGDEQKHVPVKEGFKLPTPIVEIIGRTQGALSSQWIAGYWPFIVKFFEWNFVYLLSSWGGYGWLLFFFSLYLTEIGRQWSVSIATGFAEKLSKTPKAAEKEALSEALSYYPSWMAFPDFDRVEWINEILRQLWGNLDAYATTFAKAFVEPQIHDILELMLLDQVSGFQVKRVDLGSVPARIDGIKVYDKKFMPNGCEEIIMDCDVAYSGDARVVITLQGIQAQIQEIKVRASARVHLKPLLRGFPFVGGFEFYFLSPPKLDYSLGGIGAFGDVPGISGLVRSVVQDNVRSRFVWPNRLRLRFPFPECRVADKCTYMLPRPAGLVTVRLLEARNLLKKDKHFGGSGKSDPYAVVSVGERRVSFRNQYVAKTVDPSWNYSAQFLMEDPNGQNLNVEVFDFDSGSKDDFLGKTSLPLTSLIRTTDPYDDWIALGDVKHGDVHVAAEWKEAKPVGDEGEQKLNKSCVVSVFVDGCFDLAGGGKSSSAVCPKCKITLNGRQDDQFVTPAKNKTEMPVFEQGWLLTSTNPYEDELWIEVIDVKGIDSSLGKVVIPVGFVADMPNCEFFDMRWPLEGGHAKAKMSVSAKLYSV